MRDASRLIGAILIDHDGDFDLRSADEIDIDLVVGQGLKPRRRDAGMRFHPHAHDRQFCHMFVDRDLTTTDGIEHGFEDFHGAL